MKKIQLDLDRLQVESFATAAEPTVRGTVAAHQLTTHTGQFTAEVDCTLGSRCASVSDCQDNAPDSLPLPC